jgi:Ras-related protein Rab-11A
MDDDDHYDFIFKIVLIGDSGVGKTNILSRYINNQFSLTTQATVGVEFGSKIIKKGEKLIKLQIWDTAGQERYKSITSAYYKGTKGAFIVYDISRKATFENVDKWVEELKNNGSEDVLIMLVGNKSDLKEQREIAEEDAKKKAELYNAAFCETSALEGYNIEYAFENLINEITKKVEKEREEKVGKNNGRNRMEGKMITLDTNNDKGGNSNDNKNNLIGDKKMCC